MSLRTLAQSSVGTPHRCSVVLIYMAMRKAAALSAVPIGLALLLTLGFSLFRHEAAAAAPVRSRPLVLTALPNIGTIYWRYSCGVHGTQGWSLGIHIWSNTATTRVRFKAGKLVAIRELQPGDATSWFPYSEKPVQWLAAGAGGEEGTVVGAVRVNYSYPSREPHCYPYAPPRVTVQFYPRRYYASRDFLRKFTR